MLLNYFKKGRIEVGCDEAGRGSLAGPVYAAAVILPKSFNHPLLDDSKKNLQSKPGIYYGPLLREKLWIGR